MKNASSYPQRRFAVDKQSRSMNTQCEGVPHSVHDLRAKARRATNRAKGDESSSSKALPALYCYQKYSTLKALVILSEGESHEN